MAHSDINMYGYLQKTEPLSFSLYLLQCPFLTLEHTVNPSQVIMSYY
jgi:hypothetical protein